MLGIRTLDDSLLIPLLRRDAGLVSYTNILVSYRMKPSFSWRIQSLTGHANLT